MLVHVHGIGLARKVVRLDDLAGFRFGTLAGRRGVATTVRSAPGDTHNAALFCPVEPRRAETYLSSRMRSPAPARKPPFVPSSMPLLVTVTPSASSLGFATLGRFLRSPELSRSSSRPAVLRFRRRRASSSSSVSLSARKVSSSALLEKLRGHSTTLSGQLSEYVPCRIVYIAVESAQRRLLAR